MRRKLIIAIFLFAGSLGLLMVSLKKWTNYSLKDMQLLTPISEKLAEIKKPKSEKFEEQINILLIGTDTSKTRQLKGQTGFNTDTMILFSMDTTSKRILLTSIPRDLWINGNKINALHTVYGYDTLKDAFEKVTGLPVDGNIRTDFDSFEWIVDAFGGVSVDVQRTFTDVSFPNNNDSGIVSVTFTQGNEVMDGDRSLTFARSRKGNNGEGSDLMRAKRQHLILQGMVESISQPTSRFWPMDVPEFYKIVTQKMFTDLELGDVHYLWDFYKYRDEYVIESFVINGTYVYHPGMYPQSDYHAWVFIPREPGFLTLHTDIAAKLNGTFETEAEITSEN